MDYSEHPMDISSGCELQLAFSDFFLVKIL
jgi:hypothetical protein